MDSFIKAKKMMNPASDLDVMRQKIMEVLGEEIEHARSKVWEVKFADADRVNEFYDAVEAEVEKICACGGDRWRHQYPLM